jgi:hypothetical protein
MALERLPFARLLAFGAQQPSGGTAKAAKLAKIRQGDWVARGATRAS